MLILYYTIGDKISHKIGGNKIRVLLLKYITDSVGNNVDIAQKVYLGNGKNLIIGNNSLIGPESRIVLQDFVYIGNDVQIGPRAMILTGNHNFKNKDIPFRKQGSTSKPVKIDDDVWIGANVTILPGVNVSKGAVIGAGAVVTKDIDSYTVVGGNPAKVIGYR